MTGPRVIWVVPESSGGIRSYASLLWPEVAEACASGGWTPLRWIDADGPRLETSVERLRSERPDLVHVQHEYGAFGSKVPIRYRFPSWIGKLRRALPSARIVATAHTVLPRDFRYPAEGRLGFLRAVSNLTWVPLARHLWGEETWGSLDGVIVHSRHQVAAVREAGCMNVTEIPHFVADASRGRSDLPVPPILNDIPHDRPVVLLFGFLTPEKGQDVAIRAWARIRTPAVLLIAGGLRRPEDRGYEKRVRALVDDLGIGSRVRVTGYVAENDLASLYSRAALVLAPFRETSGSGTLAQALGRGRPILASDLLLNREIAEREPGAIAFFHALDPEDCARRIDELLDDEGARAALSEAGGRYAAAHTPKQAASLHVRFYRSVLGIPPDDLPLRPEGGG